MSTTKSIISTSDKEVDSWSTVGTILYRSIAWSMVWYQFNCGTILYCYIQHLVKTHQFLQKMASKYFCIMTISAATATSPCPWRILVQHRVCYNCPHCNIICDHPAAWFGQICSFLGEIALFQPCYFCYMIEIITEHQEDGNNSNVSWLFLEIIPHPSICIFAWCELCSDSFPCPPVWSFISLDENSSLCKNMHLGNY